MIGLFIVFIGQLAILVVEIALLCIAFFVVSKVISEIKNIIRIIRRR